EADLRNITNQLANMTIGETDALRAIRTAIANIQAGAGTNAINSANEIVQAALNRALSRDQYDLQLKQLEANLANSAADRALALREFEEYKLPYLNYQINKPYYKDSTSGSGDEQTIIGGILNNNNPLFPDWFTPIM